MTAFRCGYCRKHVDSCVVRDDILNHVGHGDPTATVTLCHRCNAIWNTSQDEGRHTMGEALLDACPAAALSPEDDALAEHAGLPRFDMPYLLVHGQLVGPCEP